jgi:hypothetical protein
MILTMPFGARLFNRPSFVLRTSTGRISFLLTREDSSSADKATIHQADVPPPRSIIRPHSSAILTNFQVAENRS